MSSFTIMSALLLFFAMLLVGTPIAICLANVGIAWILSSPSLPNLTFATKIIGSTDSFSLMAIPFFMMAGQLMEHTGITEKFVAFSKSIVGHVTGGLAHTSMVAGIIMAGVSGSGNADSAAIGAMMIPAMVDEGYEEGFACNVIAAAGCLGPVIPPSIMMIVFANAADYSVGKLFMGGVIPGLLLAFCGMIVCYVYARRHNIPKDPFGGVKNIFVTFFRSLGALIMPAIIIVGITTGVCTATEAGVLASVYGLAYGLLTRKLNFKKIKECLLDACMSAAGPLLIITYSGIFSYMLTRMNASRMIGDFCVQYIHGEAAFYFFILILGLILGCFIDGLASTVMLIPVLSPIARQLGLNYQQFALIYLLSLLTSQLTPPVGNLLFVAAGIRKTPIGQVYKYCWPFVIAMIVAIIFCIYIPGLSCWLPGLIYGS